MGEDRRIHLIEHNATDGPSQCCKFSVDPQLTTINVLQNLVTRAFKLNRDFETSYLARDDRLPEAVWLPLVSDFDLELAFTRSSSPHLLVKVEYGRSHSAPGGIPSPPTWITENKLDLVKIPQLTASAANNYSNKLPGIFKEKMEKTLGLVQKALNWPEEESEASQLMDGRVTPPPLDDKKFQSFLDNVGVVERNEALRHTVFTSGLEPSLRKVAWKLLLDVYPLGLTGRERLDYMKMKSQEYFSLRDTWQKHLTAEKVCDEVSSISNMVRKDVLRTDRTHPYFAGADDNPNVICLFNILTTYSLNHPSVGYCQGMSDLASPLLVTQRDEAHAYVCFCALMQRTHPNFHIDGVAMSIKFQHLSEALMFYDPEFLDYLQQHQADDLLFCYRWLLLELKREFVFDDALLMLEVLWSSLPSKPPNSSLQLAETPFNPETALKNSSPSKSPNKSPGHKPASTALTAARLKSRMKSLQRISNYSTVCALRKQRSVEAAILSRKFSGLARTHSQPSRSRGFSKMSYDEISETVKENVLSPLSDEVFDNTEEKDSDDENLTPTRKIKNLKEFLVLGKHKSFEGINSANLQKNVESDSARNVPNVAIDCKELNDLDSRQSSDKLVSTSDSTQSSAFSKHAQGSNSIPSNSMRQLSPNSERSDVITSSSTSSALLPQSQIVCDGSVAGLAAETRRCFSESDAGFLCESSTQDETLCVEVWNNPVASSPLDETAIDATLMESEVSKKVGGRSDSTGWIVGLGGGQSTSKQLPTPDKFGGGNPFLMIVCVSIFLQHRNFIMSQGLDHNDLAMHFDKMVRKHNVRNVLRQARVRYRHYLSLFVADKVNSSEAC